MKQLVEKITEYWEIELLENIFGEEELGKLHWDYDTADGTEYEIECIVRRVKIINEENKNEKNSSNA